MRSDFLRVSLGLAALATLWALAGLAAIKYAIATGGAQ